MPVRHTETDRVPGYNNLPKKRKSSSSNHLPKKNKPPNQNRRPKFIGTRVLNGFGGHFGTVKAFEDGKYHIAYDGGGEEHCDFDQLMELICAHEESQALSDDISISTPGYEEGACKDHEESQVVSDGISGSTPEYKEEVCEDVLDKLPAKRKKRAIAALESLSEGWIPVPYKSKKSGKQEMHFKTPEYGVIFKSHRSASNFDKILRQSTNESSALESFVKDLKGGYDDFQRMVLSCGNFTRELPSYSKLIAAGWKKIVVNESKGQVNYHWKSPGFGFQFRYYKAAKDFETLRNKFNGDEVKAGKWYVKKLKGKQPSHYVVGGLKTLVGNKVMNVREI